MWKNSKTRTAGTSSHSMVPSTAIAMLVTEDARGKVESIRGFMRPWPVVKLFREYMERNLRPGLVPDALWELPASKARH